MSITPAIRRGEVSSRAINDALLDAVVTDSFTVAQLPAASAHKGKMVHVTNASGGACIAFSDGTNWKIVAALGATVS